MRIYFNTKLNLFPALASMAGSDYCPQGIKGYSWKKLVNSTKSLAELCGDGIKTIFKKV